MDNGEWTIVVFPSEMILIVRFADTFIVHCPFSIALFSLCNSIVTIKGGQYHGKSSRYAETGLYPG